MYFKVNYPFKGVREGSTDFITAEMTYRSDITNIQVFMEYTCMPDCNNWVDHFALWRLTRFLEAVTISLRTNSSVLIKKPFAFIYCENYRQLFFFSTRATRNKKLTVQRFWTLFQETKISFENWDKAIEKNCKTKPEKQWQDGKNRLQQTNERKLRSRENFYVI